VVRIFVEGLLIGCVVAAPVGPVGLLCMHCRLNRGKMHGFVSGIGAAAADAFYAMVTAFGLTIVSNFLAAEESRIRLVGGVLLCLMGIRMLLSKSAGQTQATDDRNYLTSFVSTFLLTLSNPMTFITFAAIFAGLGLPGSRGHLESLVLTAGVFTGSGLCFTAFSLFAGGLLERFVIGKLAVLNHIAGAAIICFGLVIFFSAIK